MPCSSFSTVGNQINDVQNRLAETSSPVTVQYLNDMLRVYRQRENNLRRMIQRTDALLGLMENRQEEFARREQNGR